MKKTWIVAAALLPALMCGCKAFNLLRRPRPEKTLQNYPELYAALEREQLAEAVEGKVLIVMVWTRSCPYCVNATIPHLKTLYGNYHALGLEIVGVNVDIERDRKALEDFISENHIKYRNIFDDGKISSELNVDGYPTLYIFDKQGVMVEANFDRTDPEGLSERIAGLLE